MASITDARSVHFIGQKVLVPQYLKVVISNSHYTERVPPFDTSASCISVYKPHDSRARLRCPLQPYLNAAVFCDPHSSLPLTRLSSWSLLCINSCSLEDGGSAVVAWACALPPQRRVGFYIAPVFRFEANAQSVNAWIVTSSNKIGCQVLPTLCAHSFADIEAAHLLRGSSVFKGVRNFNDPLTFCESKMLQNCQVLPLTSPASLKCQYKRLYVLQ